MNQEHTPIHSEEEQNSDEQSERNGVHEQMHSFLDKLRSDIDFSGAKKVETEAANIERKYGVDIQHKFYNGIENLAAFEAMINRKISDSDGEIRIAYSHFRDREDAFLHVQSWFNRKVPEVLNTLQEIDTALSKYCETEPPEIFQNLIIDVIWVDTYVHDAAGVAGIGHEQKEKIWIFAGFGESTIHHELLHVMDRKEVESEANWIEHSRDHIAIKGLLEAARVLIDDVDIEWYGFDWNASQELLHIAYNLEIPITDEHGTTTIIPGSNYIYKANNTFFVRGISHLNNLYGLQNSEEDKATIWEAYMEDPQMFLARCEIDPVLREKFQHIQNIIQKQVPGFPIETYLETEVFEMNEIEPLSIKEGLQK